jgi:hypothetical protein
MEFTAKDEDRPLIPAGQYMAKCTKHEENICFGKRKIFLHFTISSGEYMDTQLFMVFNMQYDSAVALGSKYYRSWCMAHGKKPSRNAEMSPRVFLNKNYVVIVRTVATQYNGSALPDFLHYSVVGEILNTGDL